MMTNKDYNVDLADSQDRKIMCDFAKEMSFDEKAPGNKSTIYRFPIRLLKSPSVMVSSSGVWSSHKKSHSQKQDFYHLIPNNYVIG